MPGSNEYSQAPIVGFGVNGSQSGSGGVVTSSGSGSGSSSVSGFGQFLSKLGAAVSPLSGIAGLVSSVLNPILQRSQNKSNREWARDQALLENRLNIEQWNRENAYNSPAAQMQRYIDAGLNPNLIVGQQNLSASSPAMTSAKDAPAGIAPQLDLAQGAVQAAQVRNLNAQSSLMEEQSKLPEEQLKLIASQYNLNSAQTRQFIAQTEVTWKSLDEMQQRIDLQEVEKRLKNLTFDDLVKQIKAQASLSDQQAKTYISIIYQSFADSYLRLALGKSTIKLNESEMRLKNSLTNFYNKMSTKTATENDFIQVEKDLLDVYGGRKYESEIGKNYRSGHGVVGNNLNDILTFICGMIGTPYSWEYISND